MGRNRAIGNRLRAGGSSTDSDALGWAAAVTAAGGTYTAAHLSAVSTAIRGFKSNGTWTKRVCYNPMAGDQLTAALIQYKSGLWAAATNFNFVAGDYTPTTGITGNGTTKYLDSGLLASALTTNDAHLAAYNRSSLAASGGGTIGAGNGGGQQLSLFAPFTDGSVYSEIYNNTAGAGAVVVAVTGPYGFIVGSRTSAAAHAVYKNGSSIGSNATVAGLVPTVTFFIFASNGGGVAANFISHSLASYSIGAGLTAAEVAADYTIEQAYQTAMGRNV